MTAGGYCTRSDSPLCRSLGRSRNFDIIKLLTIPIHYLVGGRFIFWKSSRYHTNFNFGVVRI